jgi:hypothetical protein
MGWGNAQHQLRSSEALLAEVMAEVSLRSVQGLTSAQAKEPTLARLLRV